MINGTRFNKLLLDRKFFLAAIFGMLTFFVAPYGIQFRFDEIYVHLPWFNVFIAIIALAYGFKYTLVTLTFGGAWYPFYIWPDDGWANLLSSGVLFLFGWLLSSVQKFNKNPIFRGSNYASLLFAISSFVLVHGLLQYHLQSLLHQFNPPFWNQNALTSLDKGMLKKFVVKNAITNLYVVLLAETILRINNVRSLFGLDTKNLFRFNGRVLFFFYLGLLLICISYLILDFYLIPSVENKPYLQLFFPVVILGGSIIARLTITFVESKIESDIALQRRTNELTLILENIPAIIYRSDAKSPLVMESSNHYVEQMLSLNKMTKHINLKELVFPDDIGKVESSKKSISPGGFESIDYRVIDKNGVIIWVRDQFKMDTESPMKIDGIIYNITDQINKKEKLITTQKYLEEMVNHRTSELETVNKKLEEKHLEIKQRNQELEQALNHLKETQKQLIQSEKMSSLGVLTAGIAHEINNPLNFIQAGIYGLEDVLESEGEINKTELKEITDAIEEGVQRVTRIVKSLNNYSRKDSNYTTRCNLKSIANDAAMLSNHEWKDKIVVDTSKISEKSKVFGNHDELTQVFLNLIMNAIHALEGKGEIVIESEQTENEIAISISDNGKGMSEEVKEKVFDPFFTTKPVGQGVGLGMSIVYEIIQRHGARIEYFTEEGKGTTVKLTFNIADE